VSLWVRGVCPCGEYDVRVPTVLAVQVPPVSDFEASAMAVEKMERLSLEYSLLLTSQLETQRDYFEGLLVRAREHFFH
jgi:hypothetical protein